MSLARPFHALIQLGKNDCPYPLQYENDTLRKKVLQLKKRNQHLQQQLEECSEVKLEKVGARQETKTIAAQTDALSRYTPLTSACRCHCSRQDADKKSKTDVDMQQERIAKLLKMHDDLMKRYDREIKANLQNVDTIAVLHLKVHELEQDLVDLKNQKGPKQSDFTRMNDELKKLKKEKCKWVKQKEKFVTELKSFDHYFFDEIEDMKYSLQQSVALNKHYETVLKAMCNRFGVPYPGMKGK